MFSLFAQNKAAGSPFDRPELIWASVGLAAALLFGAIAIYLVDKWRRRELIRDREEGLELTDFRGMFERGEITKPEYDRLRQKVADRSKGGSTSPPGTTSPPNFVPGPFPEGFFDDPTTSPPGNSPPPPTAGGTAPPA